MIQSPFTTETERGAYSAIVFTDGDYTIAENNEGKTIEESTNARTTIQAVIDALTSGGRVFIREGQYDIPSQINFDQANLEIYGEGRGTILKQSANYNIMMNVTANGFKLSSLKIDGNKATVTTGTRNIYLDNCDYCEISNCYFIDAEAIAIRGYMVEWLKILNNNILNTGNTSIYVTNDSKYIAIKNNNIQNSAWHGIYLESTVSYSELTGNFVKDATKFGIGLKTTCLYDIISNNTILSCTLDNINVNSSNYSTVSGNISVECVESGICYFNDANFGVISGNLVYDNWHYGLNLDGIRYSTITGNHAKENSGVGSGTYSGIGIRHTGTNQTSIENVISGNYSQGTNQNYGISLETATDNYNIVIGNMVKGNVTGGVNNPTANSEVAHNMS